MANLVRNERTKLTATYLNGLAIAVFAVGALAPSISAASSQARLWPVIAPTIVICILISAALHFAARRSLKGLEDEQ
jgi:hypothetical protein